jgi:hypothetical protein
LTTSELRYHPTFRERGIHGVPPPVFRGASTTSAPVRTRQPTLTA